MYIEEGEMVAEIPVTITPDRFSEEYWGEE